jgi:hypothetical protein
MVRKMKTRRLLYLFAAGERSKYIRNYTKRASSPREINMRCTCECRGKERQLKRIFTFCLALIQTELARVNDDYMENRKGQK